MNSFNKDTAIRKILRYKSKYRWKIQNECSVTSIFVLIPFLTLYFEEFVRFRVSTNWIIGQRSDKRQVTPESWTDSHNHSDGEMYNENWSNERFVTKRISENRFSCSDNIINMRSIIRNVRLFKHLRSVYSR